MTREETIALWQRCEAARTAALASSKNEPEAHEAATAVWNGWASSLPCQETLSDGEWQSLSLVDFSFVQFRREDDLENKQQVQLNFTTLSHRGRLNFSGYIFPGDARYGMATFSGYANFSGAIFHGFAWFESATFSHEAGFLGSIFLGRATFVKSTFLHDAVFMRAQFLDSARYSYTEFRGIARFDDALFVGDATFYGAKFAEIAVFEKVTFSRGAAFSGATFSSIGRFPGATFSGDASFSSATFLGLVFLGKTRFSAAASFAAIQVSRAFDLNGAQFMRVPDFIQAHFDEAPRLDNVSVRSSMIDPGRARTLPARLFRGWQRRIFRADRDTPARYRALRRLAIQAHDFDRELMFFAGEVRSARFATDWPLPWLPWRRESWVGLLRFWIGIVYELLSNFGRSVVRPFLWWCLLLVAFALYYLGQSPDVSAQRALAHGHGVASYTAVSLTAWRNDQPCWSSGLTPPSGLSGLMPPVRAQTSAATEALQLSIRNAFIVLDSAGDAAHRTYGCLYGVERYGDNPVAFVPSNVSFASALQKLASSVLIFLFGLGIRNMLKMK